MKEVEHTTRVTMCCEVEPEVGYGTTECPECNRFDPRTIKRVTIERREWSDE